MENSILNFEVIKQQIAQYEKEYRRAPGSVQLLAVSKRHRADTIKKAYTVGQRLFGENLLQEALDKMERLQDCEIEWHYIGRIQSNKTAKIAQAFSWVHSLDRIKIAEKLHEQRPASLPALNVCIQVNIDDESQKAGIDLSELSEFAGVVNGLPHLKLRGLMTIPKAHKTFATQRAAFAKCRIAFDMLNSHGYACDTLSMGMSNDYEAAIAEGATIIRLGTALFGERAK
jgi:PLP dependent protein